MAVLDRIVFHQTMVTPHMAELAIALSNLGHDVCYCATELMAPNRAKQGWVAPELGQVALQLLPDEASIERFLDCCPSGAIHICQGFRGNGMVGKVQKSLRARGLHCWIAIETIDDSLWSGSLKRMMYASLIRTWKHKIFGALAIGHKTPAWLVSRGMSAERVFPFAYFLKASASDPASSVPSSDEADRFRVIFVGNHIGLKRLNLLIDALGEISDASFEFTVIGTGPLESKLFAKAKSALGAANVRWIGRLPMEAVHAEIARADCLVLPSRHDGWGAVISEALLLGTPVICSDRCGAAHIVDASGRGSVVPADNRDLLRKALARAMADGPQSRDARAQLAEWARCLGAPSGAAYLEEILKHTHCGTPRPAAPWDLAELRTV